MSALFYLYRHHYFNCRYIINKKVFPAFGSSRIRLLFSFPEHSLEEPAEFPSSWPSKHVWHCRPDSKQDVTAPTARVREHGIQPKVTPSRRSRQRECQNDQNLAPPQTLNFRDVSVGVARYLITSGAQQRLQPRLFVTFERRTRHGRMQVVENRSQ